MAADRMLRERLVELLEGGQAHVTFEDAIEGFPRALRGSKPSGASHTPWQVLEHLRISQWDILGFSRDPAHRSPKFPDGYWPEQPGPADPGDWDRSVQAFRADREAMQSLVSDPARDLNARIDHTDARPHHTLLREALVLIDHNAYHLGELVLLRRMLGAWPAA